ncbi:MAG TPA: hypothetical protein VGG57_22375 [Stellaceae bacterium]|jgi:hypothetical protein
MRSHLAIIVAALLTGTPVMAQKLPVPSPSPLPKHISAAASGCPTTYAPVCAKKSGDAKSYRNDCLARSDGAGNVKPGHCSPGD